MQMLNQKVLNYLEKNGFVYTFRNFHYGKGTNRLINKAIKARITDEIEVLGEPRRCKSDLDEFKKLTAKFCMYSGFSSPLDWENAVYKLNKSEAIPKYLVRVEMV